MALALALFLAWAPSIAAQTALPGTIKALKAQAEAGNVDAQTALGRVYTTGWYHDERIPADVAKAREWLTKAADAGSAEAAFDMGKTWYPNDLVEAVPWYRKAAEGGITAVNPRLCKAYRAEALYNWDEALIWCAKAAQAGDTAQYLAMARAAEQGLEGQPKSPETAAAIYGELAELGVDAATLAAADYYGKSGDGAQSLKYTRLAVGMAPEVYIAQLARHYDAGTGVAQDKVEAARLYQYALRFDTAKTPQTEAREWLAAHPDITRKEVDAGLLRVDEVRDLSALRHGFARQTVDGGKTISDIYPRMARLKNIDGVAILECRVTEAGELANCMVASETPQGMDFGRQTLLAVSKFGLNSATPEGFKPIAGRLVHIPFAWRLD